MDEIVLKAFYVLIYLFGEKESEYEQGRGRE